MAGGSNADLRERVQKLAALMGVTDDPLDLDDLITEIYRLKDGLNQFRETIQQTCEATNVQVEDLQKENETLNLEIVVLRRTLDAPGRDSEERSKVKIPEPAFSGARSAKELENFLWDMEQYFVAAKIPNGRCKTMVENSHGRQRKSGQAQDRCVGKTPERNEGPVLT